MSRGGLDVYRLTVWRASARELKYAVTAAATPAVVPPTAARLTGSLGNRSRLDLVLKTLVRNDGKKVAVVGFEQLAFDPVLTGHDRHG